MVHQHFQLVPVFDVVEAVALGAESVSGVLGAFDRKTARRRVSELSEQYRLNVNPDAKIEDLPVGVRQRVEILKALYRKSDILVLDEPSAVLTPFETEELFGIIRGLAEAGTTIIFITHKLNEVLEVADRITVLRRGRVAGTVVPTETTREQLANLMVGRDVELRVVKSPAKPGEVVLTLKDVNVLDDGFQMAVKDVSLEVRAGEIVALAGVQGNGQTELVEAIVGLRPADSGDILVGDENVTSSTPRKISDLGVAHIPEDRMRDGLIPHMTVAENYILDQYHREPYSTRGSLNRPAIHDGARGGRQGVRHPHAVDLDPRGLAVRRQPAEGGRRAGVLAAGQGGHRVPADARPRRGLDRVHPQADRRAARRRGGHPDRQHRARRGARCRRPDRDHARGTHRGGARGGRGDLREGRDAHGRCRVTRLRRLLGPMLVPFLAIVTAFIVGSLFILITDFDNLSKLGTDPAGAIGGAFGNILNAYGSMAVGALGDPAKVQAAIGNPSPGRSRRPSARSPRRSSPPPP